MSQKQLDLLLVSRKECARLLSLAPRTIDDYIKSRQLEARRIGGRVMVPYSALRAFAMRDQSVPTRKAA